MLRVQLYWIELGDQKFKVWELVFLERKEGEAEGLVLTHHADSLRNLLQTLALLAWVSHSQEHPTGSAGEAGRGGSMRAWAKPCMGRGVAKPSARPSGKTGSCPLATTNGRGAPSSLFSDLRSIQAASSVSAKTPQLA